MKAVMSKVRAFAREEDGVALTEYLILLGLLTAAVVTAVTLSGTALGAAWGDWQAFFEDLDGRAPTLPPA